MSLQELEDHFAASQMSREDVAAIRRAAMELRARGSGTGPKMDQCLDEFAVVDLVDDSVDRDRRASMLRHLTSCASCRSEVSALSRLVTEPAIRSELEQLRAATSRTAWRRRFTRLGGVIGAATAAAAVAFLLISRPPEVEDPAAAPGHRAGVLTLSAPPVAIGPAGLVATPIQFVWTSVPRADRYELTLFDRTGSILWEMQTTDTVAVAPDSVGLTPGASYFWRAEARIDFDRWSESSLMEFILRASSDSTPR
jgi:hypothetical protein